MPLSSDLLPVRIALVAGGGAIGCALRYGTTLLCGKVMGTFFPWGTLAVNLAGCLMIGAFSELGAKTLLAGPGTRLFFVTGFLGGLTTFSTYSLESVNAMNDGSWSQAGLNIIGNNALGLALVFCGMRLMRSILT
jgi:CrcB protein